MQRGRRGAQVGGIGRQLAALACLLLLPGPALAQTDLRPLVSGQSAVTLPGGGTTGRADLDGRITITGSGSETPLTAPQDDAILVAQPGSEIELRNVLFRRSGSERFAIYVNGGTVRIDGCATDGAFDTAFYVASGSLTLTGCAIAGPVTTAIAVQPGGTLQVAASSFASAQDVMIYADGAQVSIEGSEIADAAGNGLLLLNGTRARLTDLVMTGRSETLVVLGDGVAAEIAGLTLEAPDGGGTGLYAQNVAALDATRVSARGGLTGGLIVRGAQALRLRGLELATASDPLQVTDTTGPVEISDGQIAAPPGGTGMLLSNVPGLRAQRLLIDGGEVGAYLSGGLDGAELSDTVFTGQDRFAVALQDVVSPVGAPVALSRLATAGTGEAIALYAANAGPVTLRDNTFLTQSSLAVYLENADLFDPAGNRVIASPLERDRTYAVHDLDGDGARVFVTDGPVDPIEGGDAGAGTLPQSPAELLLAEGLTRDESLALARFAAGETDIDLLALATALAVPPAPREDAGSLVEIRLAPPVTGGDWLPDAVEIGLTAPNGDRHQLRPGDFPADLPAGSYALTLDGRAAGGVTLAADSPLVLPDRGQPFLFSLDADGNLFRGPDLVLRPAAHLARMSEGWRPFRIDEFDGFAAYSIARAGADRALAAEMVAEARDRLPTLEADLAAARAGEAWFEVNRLWHTRRMYLEILAEFAGPEADDWLTGVLAAGNFDAPAIQTLARRDARLGLLEGGLTRAEAERRLAADPEDGIAAEMVLALARLGDPWGLRELARLHRARVAAAPPTDSVFWAIETLTLLPPAEGLPIMQGYLDRLRRSARSHALGLDSDWTHLKSGIVWRNAGLALAYIARHDPDGARSLTLPVPGAAEFVSLLPFVEDPAALMSAYLGGLPDAPESRINNWMSWHGTRVCDARILRAPTDARRVSEEIDLIVADRVRRFIVTDYWDRSARDRQATDNSIWFAFGLSPSHCELDGDVTDLAMSEGAAGEEARKFDQNGYDPAWWHRPTRAQRIMENFAPEEGYLQLNGLAQYDTDQLLAWLEAAGGTGYAELARVFEAHHRLLTDAQVSPQYRVSFQSERRVFRLRNDGGDGSVSLAGQVDIRPIPDGDRMIVALRHDILSPDYGGLAAMITEPERTPFEADNRRRMFETVALERDGVATELEFTGTTPAGVHLFEGPFDGDLSGLYLRIGMRFVDTTWPLDVSLFDSHLAVDLRRAALFGGSDRP